MWHVLEDLCLKLSTKSDVRNYTWAATPHKVEAYTLLRISSMKATGPVCEHCGEMYQGRAYRVTSEEDGILLLDMIVCSSCSIEARRLGLDTRKHDIRHIAFN